MKDAEAHGRAVMVARQRMANTVLNFRYDQKDEHALSYAALLGSIEQLVTASVVAALSAQKEVST